MIHLTEAAIARITEVTALPSLGIRIEVTSGGCAGFKYKFTEVIDACAEDDIVIEAGRYNLFIDPISAKMIDGATVDFESTIMAQQFVINIPNSTMCGCGESFS